MIHANSSGQDDISAGKATSQLLAEACRGLENITELYNKKAKTLDNRQDQMESHLRELEMEFARFPTHARAASSGGPLSAMLAVEELEKSQSFGHLKAWNVGTSRVGLESDLRNALTTDGLG